MRKDTLKNRLTKIEKAIQPATRLMIVYELDGQYYEGDPPRGKRVPRAQIEATDNDPRATLVVIKYQDAPQA